MFSKLIEKLRAPSEPEAEEDLTRLAAAALFLEVAWADHDVAEEELNLARESLMSVLGLERGEVDEVIESSLAHLDSSVGMQTFTRALVDAWDMDARFELIVQLWRLAFVDNQLDKYEEATIRKIADLLYVSHARFIEAKGIARDQA